MLTATELLASDVVANATMNRGRGLSGVNSYQKELRFDIAAFLQARVEERGSAVWYDACCGEGRALAEAGREFAAQTWGKHVRIVGVDLVDLFVEERPECVRFVTTDVTQFDRDVPADLITCVHGLHYVGDKLGFLQRVYQNLAPSGIFLGHVDAANLHLSMPWTRLLRQVRSQGIDIDYAAHRLRFKRTTGALDFGCEYVGTTVSEQPNYTGITVIDSWYTASHTGLKTPR